MIAVGTGLATSLDSATAAEMCQSQSDTVALTHAAATADQSVTPLEYSRSDGERAVGNTRGRKHRKFV